HATGPDELLCLLAVLADAERVLALEREANADLLFRAERLVEVEDVQPGLVLRLKGLALQRPAEVREVRAHRQRDATQRLGSIVLDQVAALGAERLVLRVQFQTDV